ncbi:MAG: hypothetical protein K9N46_07465 [Candidatus Marinimicrobia bacterium]|nr:hypothetical protein [Candidatus Neomarinimicrobiota bacterium]MCF7880561.1 hypothetical protein [Candidatus Neomarinimicrobiota bacterium]
MMVTCHTPGKMILLGEYAVLDGAPALVTAVDKYAKVSIQEAENGHWSVSAPTLHISRVGFSTDAGRISFEAGIDSEHRIQLQFFKKAVETSFADLEGTLPPANIRLDTDDFYANDGRKYGFGGSAALTVALVSALAVYSGAKPLPSENSLFSRAYRSHSEAQGKFGSGIDIATSIYGGIIEYTRAEPANKTAPISMDLPENFYILPVWTGKSASTSRILKRLENYRVERAKDYRRIFKNLNAISRDGCRAFHHQDIQRFFTDVDKFYHSMERLGELIDIPVVSAEHKAIYHLVRDTGGYYKPSGAGNGDIGIAFTDSKTIMQDIKTSIIDSNFTLPGARISHQGVHVSNNESTVAKEVH